MANITGGKLLSPNAGTVLATSAKPAAQAGKLLSPNIGSVLATINKPNVSRGAAVLIANRIQHWG